MIFYHQLKLFSTDPEVVTGKKPLVNEYYDELVNLFFLISLKVREREDDRKRYFSKCDFISWLKLR